MLDPTDDKMDLVSSLSRCSRFPSTLLCSTLCDTRSCVCRLPGPLLQLVQGGAAEVLLPGGGRHTRRPLVLRVDRGAGGQQPAQRAQQLGELLDTRALELSG